MANGDYEIDEVTFSGLSITQQNWILFRTFNRYREESERRFKILEDKKIVDRAIAGGSGFIGGFIASLTKYLH